MNMATKLKEEESEARQKARDDWRADSTYNNKYERGTLKSLAYGAEFIRVASLFGETNV